MPRIRYCGDLSRFADPRAREPWQVLADVSLREADYRTPPPERRPRVRLGLTPTWTAGVVHYDPKNGPCPTCGDATLRPHEVCLVCHATAADPTRWPMQPPIPRRRRRGAKCGANRNTPRVPQAGHPDRLNPDGPAEPARDAQQISEVSA